MRHTGLVVTLCALALLIPSCREDGVLHPKTGPGTEYPCGVHGQSCAPVGAPGMCCSTLEVCGYKGPFSTCPAGYCCFVGDNWPRVSASQDGGSTTDAGVSKMRPQVPEHN